MGGSSNEGLSCVIDFYSACRVGMVEMPLTDKRGCHKESDKVRCICHGRHCNSDFKKYQSQAISVDSSLSKCDFSNFLSFSPPTNTGDIICFTGTTPYPFGKSRTFYQNGVWRGIEKTIFFPGEKGVCGIRFYTDCTIEMAPSNYEAVKFLEKCSKLDDGSVYCTCMYKDNCNSDIAYWKEEAYWTVKDVDLSHCNWEGFPDYPAVMGTTPGPRTPRATMKTVETSTASRNTSPKRSTKNQTSVNTTESSEAEPSSTFSVSCSVLVSLVVFRVF